MGNITFCINGKEREVDDFYMRFNNKAENEEYEYGYLVYFITENNKKYCVKHRMYRDEKGNVRSTDNEDETEVYLDQKVAIPLDNIKFE